jgi:hypothetical protein
MENADQLLLKALRRWMPSMLLGICLMGPGACGDDNMFSPCPFSNSIEESCSEDTAKYTCVVAAHPYCDEQVCLSWLESAPFCTQVCQADTDCPSGSTCRDYLEDSYCVPDSYE